MSKNTAVNTVNVEKWTVQADRRKPSLGYVAVEKVAVRNRLGQFHGATNFRGSVLGK